MLRPFGAPPVAGKAGSSRRRGSRIAGSIAASVCSTSGMHASYTSSIGSTISPAANLRVLGLIDSLCARTSSSSSGVIAPPPRATTRRAIASSKSSPPSRETPELVITSLLRPSMWIKEASKVPPPRS